MAVLLSPTKGQHSTIDLVGIYHTVCAGESTIPGKWAGPPGGDLMKTHTSSVAFNDI